MNSSTTNLSTDLKITNQTSKPVIMARVQEDSNTVQAAYAQPLLALPNNTQPAVIAPAATAQLSLDAPTQDAWNLIAMRPDNLFPVSNQMAVMPPDSNITLTQADSDAMQQAFTFYQNVLAYPDSNLVKNFFEVLSTYDSLSDALNLETAINQYFQQTQNFAQCTLASYIAVSTYCRNYAYAWANLQTSFTYQVFQPATDPNATVGLVYKGKIVFTKQPHAPTPANVSDCNGGYSITYQPNTGSERRLGLVDGRLSSDKTTTPAIAFLFTYGLKSTFTQVATDTTAWPVLIGKVDGVQVMAVGDIAAAPTPSSTATRLGGNWHDDWAKLFSPKSAADWAKVVGIVAAMAAGVGITAFMVYKTVQWIKAARERGEPIEERLWQKNRSSLDEPFQRTRANRQFQLKDSSDDVKIPTAPPDYQQQTSELIDIRGESIFEIQKNCYTSAVETCTATVDAMAKYGMTDQLRMAKIDSKAANQILEQITGPDLLDALRVNLEEAITRLQTSTKAAFDQSSQALKSQLKTEVERNLGTAQGYRNVVETLQEQDAQERLIEGGELLFE